MNPRDRQHLFENKFLMPRNHSGTNMFHQFHATYKSSQRSYLLCDGRPAETEKGDAMVENALILIRAAGCPAGRCPSALLRFSGRSSYKHRLWRAIGHNVSPR